MRKGDTVFYVARRGTGAIIRAKVIIAHRDGRALVEAMFFYNDGRDSGPYQGERYELTPSEIFPNAMTAEQMRSAARADAKMEAK